MPDCTFIFNAVSENGTIKIKISPEATNECNVTWTLNGMNPRDGDPDIDDVDIQGHSPSHIAFESPIGTEITVTAVKQCEDCGPTTRTCTFKIGSYHGVMNFNQFDGTVSTPPPDDDNEAIKVLAEILKTFSLLWLLPLWLIYKICWLLARLGVRFPMSSQEIKDKLKEIEDALPNWLRSLLKLIGLL